MPDKLGGAGVNDVVDASEFTDFNGSGIQLRVGIMGSSAGLVNCTRAAIGTAANRDARTDLLAQAGARWRTTDVGISQVEWLSDGTTWRPVHPIQCNGTPEAQITAPIGSLAVRKDGGAATTLYVKESGSGNTGWVAK